MTTLPGWYPDPEGANPRVTRYWDGEQWTHHRKAPPGVFVPTAHEKRRWTLRKKLVVWSVVAVLGGGAATIVAVAGGSDSSPKLTDAQYAQIRSDCEAVTTAQLPAQFVVGGSHWVGAVNSCMTDRASALLP